MANNQTIIFYWKSLDCGLTWWASKKNSVQDPNLASRPLLHSRTCCTIHYELGWRDYKFVSTHLGL